MNTVNFARVRMHTVAIKNVSQIRNLWQVYATFCSLQGQSSIPKGIEKLDLNVLHELVMSGHISTNHPNKS